MKVLKTFPTAVVGHEIEIVKNEWGLAIRCRYKNSAGRYNSSSPVVLRDDVALVARAAAVSGLLTRSELVRLLLVVAAALTRQLISPPIVRHGDTGTDGR